MNIKKTSLLAISSLLAATSAFAWSKTVENTGNLGRTSLSVNGGIEFTKMKFNGSINSTAVSSSDTPVGAAGGIVFNIPVFKPSVNVLKDVSWFGMDLQAYFETNYNGGGEFTTALPDTFTFSQVAYTPGITLLPYLNFEPGYDFLKAIKPFGIASIGYSFVQASNSNGSSEFEPASGFLDNQNYVVYSFGGGIEFVITEKLSITPTWRWNGNQGDGIACNQNVGVDITYWATNQFGISAFWSHDFSSTSSSYSTTDGDYMNVDQRADVFGLVFKLGFPR